MDIGRVSRLETALYRKVTVQCSASGEVLSLQASRNSQTFVSPGSVVTTSVGVIERGCSRHLLEFKFAFMVGGLA
jgi:hypothetical protein